MQSLRTQQPECVLKAEWNLVAEDFTTTPDVTKRRAKEELPCEFLEVLCCIGNREDDRLLKAQIMAILPAYY